MRKEELQRRLEKFRSERSVDRFEITEGVTGDLHVELTLKPNTPITERFIARLETALHQKIESLSLFRVRRNVFIIRFTLKRRDNEDSVADRIQELPSSYACARVMNRTTGGSVAKSARLEDNWREIAKFLDLVAMTNFLDREGENPKTFRTAVSVIEKTIESLGRNNEDYQNQSNSA
jgi:hypothetical protein